MHTWSVEPRQPQIQISRSGHSLTLNISKMAKDTVIITTEANKKPYPSFLMVPISMTLSDRVGMS